MHHLPLIHHLRVEVSTFGFLAGLGKELSFSLRGASSPHATPLSYLHLTRLPQLPLYYDSVVESIGMSDIPTFRYKPYQPEEYDESCEFTPATLQHHINDEGHDNDRAIAKVQFALEWVIVPWTESPHTNEELH